MKRLPEWTVTALCATGALAFACNTIFEPTAGSIDPAWRVTLDELQKKENFHEPIDLQLIYPSEEGLIWGRAGRTAITKRRTISISRQALKKFDRSGRRGLLAHELEHHFLGHVDSGDSPRLARLQEVSADRRALALIGDRDFKGFLVGEGYSSQEVDVYLRELKRLMPRIPQPEKLPAGF